MPVLFEGLGAEALVDEIFLVMREKFNDAIAYQQGKYAEYDAARAERLGIPHVPVVIEPVAADNFHVGSIPSFVMNEDRGENYPMVVVMPGRTAPDAENASADQYDIYSNTVAIHAFARAKMVTEEGYNLCYRRVMRMAEAAHQVIKTDPVVRSMVAGVSGPVMVERSEPWVFQQEDGHGDDWCWQAVMHQYQIKNYSRTPMEV